MKILIISHCPTHPVSAGNRKGILDCANLLTSMGHDVYFLYVNNIVVHSDRCDTAALDETRKYWGERLFVYNQTWPEKVRSKCLAVLRKIFSHGYMHVDDEYPAGLSNALRKLQEMHRFDGCIVNYYTYSKSLEALDIDRKALFTHDYFSFKDIATGSKAPMFMCRPDEEAKGCQRANYIFAVQDEEAAFFSRLAPKSRVLLNYVGCTHRASPVAGNHNILYLSGDNEYNLQGIKWFIVEVLPLIVSRFPDAKLIVGGKICHSLQEYHSCDSVSLLGLIDNPDDFWDMGDVAINPTFNGTGIKVKTIEALANDKVLLTHPHSMIGIFRKENAPIFSSEKARDWVKFLASVWTDKKIITDIKRQDKEYISAMNDFVISQYNLFLASDTLKH